MPFSQRYLRWSIPLFLVAFFQCSTYFNMFYNAEESYAEARKIHQKAMLKHPDSLVTAPPEDAKTKYDRAIEKSAKVLEVFPKDKKWHPAAYFLMGKSYFYEEEMGKAIRWLRQLQQEYPNSPFIPESYYYIGMAYLQDDALDKAEDVLKFTLAKYPDLDKDQKVSFLLVEIETRREGKAKAIQRLEKVRTTVKSPDKQRDLLFRVAEMYMDLRQYQQAIDLLNKSPGLKKNPEQEYRLNCDLVTSYAAIDSFNTALAILNGMAGRRRFVEHEREIVYNRGLIYEQMDNTEAAILAYKDVIGPTDTNSLRSDTSQMVGKALFRMGLLYQKRKRDYKQAQFCYSSIVDRKGHDTAVATPATSRMNAIKRIRKLRDLLSGKIKPGQDTLETTTTAARTDSVKHDSLSQDSLGYKGMKLDALARGAPFKGDSVKGQAVPGSKADSVKPVAKIKISRPDTLYKIGELFYYDLDEPDSAIMAFLKLSVDSTADSVFGPKALNAAAFIAKNNLNDTLRSDSIFRKLLKRYPGGDYARKALIELREIQDSDVTTRKGMAEADYLAAEHKYREEGDMKGAVQAFFNIYKKYSDLDIAPKSLYAAAWLTDNELRKKSAAKKLYEKICERYPNSDYCTKQAKPRVQTALDTLKAYGQLAKLESSDNVVSPAAKKPDSASVGKKPDSALSAAKRPDSASAAGKKSDSLSVSVADTGSHPKTAVSPVADTGLHIDTTGGKGHVSRPADSAAKPAAEAAHPKVSEEFLNGARILESQGKPPAPNAAPASNGGTSPAPAAKSSSPPEAAAEPQTGSVPDSASPHAGDLTGQAATTGAHSGQ